MIGNIKETFPPKLGMWKKQVLQDPGYVSGVKGPCCMLHAACYLARLYEYNTNCRMLKMSKEIKTKKNRLDLRPLFLMSKVSKAEL